MPLQAPQLDRRKFDDLYREALLRIPRYAPEWTDFNESDPGITLVQLFAWLSEMMFYQMNRVPERNYVKFLQLMNLELRPAQPAVAHLTFTALAKATQTPTVPRFSRISAQPPGGGEPLIFETEADLDLVRQPLTDVQVYDGSAFTVLTSANETLGTPLRPLGWVPQVGSALYLGFDPAETPTNGRLFPRQIRWRVFLPVAVQAGVAQNCDEIEQAMTPPVKLVWEYKFPVEGVADEDLRWRRLQAYEDGSAAFTREGYILLQGPERAQPTAEGKVSEKRLWLRCRLASGSYPGGRAPNIDFIRPNTVMAKNLATVQQEVIGTSNGHPDQTFTLRRNPVQVGSLKLSVEAADRETDWEPVDDFLASGPEDEHYVLNATKGEIRFGDGTRGLIPAAGATIVAQEYRYGGGKAGNVSRGLINAPMTSMPGVESVLNERRAVGGQDEQDVEELKEQAPAVLRSHDRAITAEDFAALAAQAGGVAKATAIALAHPDHPGVQVPGAVTVVIVPDTTDMPPRPSSEQIRAVCRYLDKRRLLTTEVYVKGPEYQAIKVEATVVAKPYASFDTVSRNVITALNKYLNPLGSASDADTDETNENGQGWQFGEELHPTNIYKVILDVNDVETVVHLALTVNGYPHDKTSEPVVVPRDGLVYGVEDHEIVVIPDEDR
jgi:predicted phage baseplate assembly protein